MRRPEIKRPLLLLWMILAGAIMLAREGGFLNRLPWLLPPEGVQEGEVVTVQGRLYRKECKTKALALFLDKAVYIGNGREIPCGNLMVLSDTGEYPLGSVLEVTGNLSCFIPPPNEGGFHEQQFYYARKIGFRILSDEIKLHRQEASFWWKGKEVLYELSNRLSGEYYKMAGEREGGVIAAMVTGNKSFLSGEIKEDFRKKGISHILAISGLHVSLICLTVYHILRRKLSFRWSCGLGSLTLFLYMGLTGGSSSILRASFMCLLYLGAALIGRTYDSLSALSLAGMLLLVDSPWLLWDTGFLLSVLAVAGTIYMSSWIHRQYRSMHWLLQGLVIGFGVQLTTIPVVAWSYFELPVFALFLNLLVIPLMSPVLAMGIISGLAGLWVPWVGRLLIQPAVWLLRLFLWLPGGTTIICGRPGAFQIFIYYLLLTVGALLFWKKGQYRYLCLGVILIGLLFYRRNTGAEYVMLDVGQGDGGYFTDGKGLHCMVDGGSVTESMVGTYRILPFLKSRQVRCIHYWFLSHGDADHISGLLELLETGYPIRYLVISDKMPKDDAYRQLMKKGKEAGVKVISLKSGQALSKGGFIIKDMTPGGNDPEDRNQNSLVLLVSSSKNKRILLGGDIGSEQEAIVSEKIRKMYPGGMTYLKANHHGAKGSNSQMLLRSVGAKICLISAGSGNSYGHPHKEAIDRMKLEGMKVLVTMKTGEIICPLE